MLLKSNWGLVEVKGKVNDINIKYKKLELK